MYNKHMSNKSKKTKADTTKSDTTKALLMFAFILAIKVAIIASIIRLGFFLVEQIRDNTTPKSDEVVQTA